MVNGELEKSIASIVEKLGANAPAVMQDILSACRYSAVSPLALSAIMFAIAFSLMREGKRREAADMYAELPFVFYAISAFATLFALLELRSGMDRLLFPYTCLVNFAK